MSKLALPKGRLQARTSELLEKAGLGFTGYTENSRNYRLTSATLPGVFAKIFQERDIAIQVAIGNYDLGICGYNWVEELMCKFPSSDIVVIRGLGYGRGRLCVAASRSLGASKPGDLAGMDRMISLASENPNLAEAYAARLRLKRYKVFPVWGAAEVYPSFAADLAIFSPASSVDLAKHDLVPLDFISSREAFLIANRRSWESVDLGQVLDLLCQAKAENEVGDRDADSLAAATASLSAGAGSIAHRDSGHPMPNHDLVRLALPDGHQQKHTVALLDRAGISISGYNSQGSGKEPGASLDGVLVKIIRPQDMPLQVANGNVDLAVTGRDWVLDHRCAFPSSPLKELVDLKFGRVKLVAVVPEGAGVESPGDLRKAISPERPRAIRVASEYTNIADKYCRDRRLGHYKVIPTWGATEAFLPEDADLLIENTETGETLARNKLKVIDTVFESTGCLLGSSLPVESPSKRAKIASVVEALRKAV